MGVVPFVLSGNTLFVGALVNGASLGFELDTGDSLGPVFNGTDASKLKLKHGKPFTLTGITGTTLAYHTTANISLGGLTFPNEPAVIDYKQKGASLLGMPFFAAKCKTMTIDFAVKELVLT
jgi:predicted aspartyl protease